ncbi:hemerythrin domain-containing protein [Intrasporangium sp. DVR]|uniref:hemerythrin domain-containing protein n=1 Tax=Intrasporangium sp. DVR TaxID=3127867 RepID=UPI00313A6A1A
MCSYCGCRSISLIGRFMDEHEDIVNAAGILQRAADGTDPHGVREALDHAIAHLHPHTSAEELGLFGVLRRNPDFTDHVDALCAEHAALDALAERIRDGETALIDRFVVELRDHIDKEENGLFPAAAIEMDGPDWEEAITLTPVAIRADDPHSHPHDDVRSH